MDSSRGLIEQQIETWVRQHVAFPDKEMHGSCNRVELKHINLERKPQGDVNAFRINLEAGAEEDGLDPLLHKIAAAAQEDADQLNQGVQSYALFAYYPSDKGYVPRKYFRVAPSDVAVERDLSPSEPPTEKGIAAQLMRHVEVIQRTSSIATAHLFTTMQGEIRRIAEMNEKFAQQQIDFMILVQDLVDNSHTRRLKEKAEEARLDTKDNILAMLASLVPVVINRIAGQPIVPEQNRSLMMMANLLENLETHQQEAFFGSLSNGQKIALAEVLSEYEKAKESWRGNDPLRKLLGKSGLVEKKESTGDESTSPTPPGSSLKDRMKLLKERPKDDKLVQIEAATRSFTSRFKSMLKPPTEGKS